MIEIRIDGAEKVESVLNGKLDAIDPALRDTGDAIFERIWAAADKHTKTGAMARSLKNAFSAGEYRIWHDMQHAPHAAFVHWGSRAHDIKPKNRKALRWPGRGGFIFAKFVRHPGYKGDPYFVTEATPDEVLKTFIRFFTARSA